MALAQHHDRLAAPIDGRKLVTIHGTRNPRIEGLADEGILDPATPIQGLGFRFKPSMEQAVALTRLLDDQQNPSSASYHAWLTPEEFGDRFGMSRNDLARVRDWLETQGFHVDYTARSRTSITFSATAGQLQRTFHTELHRFQVGAQKHFANVTEAQIPADLEPLIYTIRGLDDIGNEPVTRTKPRVTYPSGIHALAPQDLATIYNVKPLLDRGFDGSGQKIVVAGQSAIKLADAQDFRTQFGLPKNDPQIVLVPGGGDPGFTGFYDEAISDVQIAGGSAPNASIIYVYSAAGAFAAAEYAVDQNLAPVISYSYLGCEKNVPSIGALNSARAVAQQANAQGITWVASAGDNGPAGCESQGVDQYGVSGIWSTIPAGFPEITGIGGTMFAEGNGNYWGPSKGTGATALSYIPEVAWNETAEGHGIFASSGGTSRYITRPVWQTGPGLPNDTARHVPDISFTAAVYHDPYLIVEDGAPLSWGGTSAGTPFFAGVLAILNQYVMKTGVQAMPGLGNINPRLYQMAQTTSAVFHDITAGDSIIPCTIGTPDCTSGEYGYQAGPGYDLVTGLGSLDIYNFFQNWASAPSVPGVVSTTASLSANPSTLPGSGATTITASVKAASGTTSPSGFVYFTMGEKNLGTASLSGSGGIATGSVTVMGNQLNSGTNTIMALYGGAATFLSSTASVTVTVTASGALSNVIASVDPSPVPRQAPDADGYEWFYTIRLKETAGVNTTITGLSINGVDYTSSLTAFFNSLSLFANGTLTASLRAKGLDVPASYVFVFSGVDPGGQKWTRQLTVAFVGDPGAAAMSLTSTPSTVVKSQTIDPHCSTAYPFYQRLNLQELNGYGVKLTRFLAGGNDFSSGIQNWFGSVQLPAYGTLHADLCWQLNSLPTTLSYEVDGVDVGGHTVPATLQVTFTDDPLGIKSGGAISGGASGVANGNPRLGVPENPPSHPIVASPQQMGSNR